MGKASFFVIININIDIFPMLADMVCHFGHLFSMPILEETSLFWSDSTSIWFDINTHIFWNIFLTRHSCLVLVTSGSLFGIFSCMTNIETPFKLNTQSTLLNYCTAKLLHVLVLCSLGIICKNWDKTTSNQIKLNQYSVSRLCSHCRFMSINGQNSMKYSKLVEATTIPCV